MSEVDATMNVTSATMNDATMSMALSIEKRKDAEGEKKKEANSVGWWTTAALSKGSRRLISPDDETEWKKKKKLHPVAPQVGAVKGILHVYLDRVEFVPSTSSNESREVIRLPFDAICAVRHQVDDGLTLVLTSGRSLFAHAFVDVFRSLATHAIISNLSEYAIDKRPVLTAQAVGRIAYPDHTYWAQNAGECVVGVLVKQQCVITNQRIIFQRIKEDYEYGMISSLYIADKVSGGLVIVVVAETDDNESIISVPDFPAAYGHLLVEAWLSWTYSDIKKDNNKVDKTALTPAIRSVLRVIYKHFAALDINHNGTISNEELAEALGPVLGPRIEEMLAYMDTNQDGVMSFREFLQAMMTTAFPSDEKSLSATLHILDLDHNGSLSDDELVNASYLIVTNAGMSTVLQELRNKFGDGKTITDEVPIDQVTAEMLANPKIRSVLNLKALSSNGVTEEKKAPMESHTVTLGHRDWVLGTFIMCVSVLKGNVSLPVTPSQIKAMERYADASCCLVSSSLDSTSISTAVECAAGTLLLRSHAGEDFAQLRTHFGFASEYYRSLNMDAVFESILAGQDMGVLDCIDKDSSSAPMDESLRLSSCNPESFRFSSRDGLFLIKSMSHLDAERFLKDLPKYIVYVAEQPDTLIPKMMSLSSIHFLNTHGVPSEIYFSISMNPVRTLAPIYSRYALKGITGRVGAAGRAVPPKCINEGQLFEGDLMFDITLSEEVRSTFIKQLTLDTEYLCNANMEYSLLVATAFTKPETKPEKKADEKAEKKLANKAARGHVTRKWWCCGTTQLREGTFTAALAKARLVTKKLEGLPSQNEANISNWTDSGYTTSNWRGMSSQGRGKEGEQTQRYIEGTACVNPYETDKDGNVFLSLSNVFAHSDALPPEAFRQRFLSYVDAHFCTQQNFSLGRRFSAAHNLSVNTEILVDVTFLIDGKKGLIEVNQTDGMLMLKSSKGNVTYNTFLLSEVSIVRSHDTSKKSQCEILLRHSGDDGEFDFTTPIAFPNHLNAEWAYHRLRRATNSHSGALNNTVPGYACGMARVFIGTWNVGNKQPTPLKSWLSCGANCDIIIVSSQECIPKDSWMECIRAALPVGFVLVHHTACWDIHLAAYCKSTSMKRLSHIEAHTEATGIGHVLGNKGGVCISMRVDDSSIVFFGSHLAAHLEKVEQRNSDFAEVMGEISVSLSPTKQDITNAVHHAFWCGDLNYRLMGDMATVIEMSNRGEFEELYKSDQLQIEMAKGNVFFGFQDSKPYFPPTYKYKVSHGNPMATREYDKDLGRTPSWCDRVLHHPITPNSPIDVATLKQFGCCNDIQTSDHSPVYAVYEVNTRMYSHAGNADAPPTAPIFLTVKITALNMTKMSKVSSDALVCHISSRLFPSVPAKIGKDIKVKVPIVDKEVLAQEYVAVSIVKFALLRNVSVGSAVVPLFGSTFNVPLTMNGHPVGNLEGTCSF